MAFLMFAFTVINTHPDLAKLQIHLETADLAATGRLVSEVVSDDFLEGMTDVMERLKKCAEMERLKSGLPRVVEPN
jgi:hypothetical protein